MVGQDEHRARGAVEFGACRWLVLSLNRGGQPWADETRAVLANFEVHNSAFSVARLFCDGGRRDGPPLAPPSKGGETWRKISAAKSPVPPVRILNGPGQPDRGPWPPEERSSHERHRGVQRRSRSHGGVSARCATVWFLWIFSGIITPNSRWSPRTAPSKALRSSSPFIDGDWCRKQAHGRKQWREASERRWTMPGQMLIMPRGLADDPDAVVVRADWVLAGGHQSDDV